jgi:hypothetical protein
MRQVDPDSVGSGFQMLGVLPVDAFVAMSEQEIVFEELPGAEAMTDSPHAGGSDGGVDRSVCSKPGHRTFRPSRRSLGACRPGCDRVDADTLGGVLGGPGPSARSPSRPGNSAGERFQPSLR